MFVFVVEWNFSSACKTGLLAKHSHRLIIAPTSAMARLLIAVLAVTTTSAFKTPKRALKVRGGVDIQKVGTALIGLEGIVGMIAPETACKNYGHTPSADDIQFKRYTSAWLAALALLFSSDASSAASTTRRDLRRSRLTFLACVVAFFFRRTS